MSFLFGSTDTVDATRRRQEKTTAAKTTQALNQFKPIGQTVKPIKNAISTIKNSGLGPTSVDTSGLGISIGQNNIDLTRSQEMEGLIGQLYAGGAIDQSAYNDLLSKVAPGFGLLTQARRKEITNTYDRAFSNLQSQMQRRRVAGSSFANGELSSLDRQRAQDLAAADAQSIVEELNLTGQVLQQRTQARQQMIETGLNQANFESNLGAQILADTRQQTVQQQQLLAGLAETQAQLALNQQIAKANTVTGNSQALLQSYPAYADLKTQVEAGPGELLGTAAGIAAASI